MSIPIEPTVRTAITDVANACGRIKMRPYNVNTLNYYSETITAATS